MAVLLWPYLLWLGLPWPLLLWLYLTYYGETVCVVWARYDLLVIV